jgi:hypothetical protein
VATKRWILFLLSAAMIPVLAGCNSGSTFNVQNPPPPPPSTVTVAFQSQPVLSIAVGFMTNLTAVVTNDAHNYGVDWTLVCPSNVGAGNCGTLSPQHTTCQGTTCGSTTFQAPSPITGNSETVNIVAYATADHAKNVVATINVNSFDSSLKAGNYVLQAQGNQGGSFYQFVGVITLDGQGNVTAGEQTFNSGVGLASVTDSINPVGSSYFLGNDGQGTITLTDPTVGVEIFSFVFLGSSQNPQALISQTGIDGAAASATGTMELQTSIAAPTGSYAFVTSGIATQNQFALTLPIALGGILNIDSNNNLSGLGDEIFGRQLTLNGAPLCSTAPCTISTPDAFGQVIFNLTPGFGFHNRTSNFQLTGYIVDTTHIRLIESDYTTTNAAPFGLTGGLAIAQSAGSANNFVPGSLSGPYVFGVTGVDLSGGNITPSTLTSVGLFTADGNLNLTNGFTDTFLLFNSAQGTNNNPQTGAQISAAFNGSYSVDQTGRAVLNPTNFMPPPPYPQLRPAYAPELVFYLTDSQNPAPALVLTGMQQGPPPPNSYPSLGTGIAYPQSTASPVFGGDYGFSITQFGGASENDGTAQMNANPTNAPAVSGLADTVLAPPPPIDSNLSDHAFTGSFDSPQANGMFMGSFLDTGSGIPFGVGNNANGNFAVDYYIIDQDHGFFIETDLVNSIPPTTPPTPSGQMSIGYYVARVPLCNGCP